MGRTNVDIGSCTLGQKNLASTITARGCSGPQDGTYHRGSTRIVLPTRSDNERKLGPARIGGRGDCHVGKEVRGVSARDSDHPRGSEPRTRRCTKIRACVHITSNCLAARRPGRCPLLRTVLSPAGLGGTCLRIGHGKKTTKMSGVRYSQLLNCLLRRGRALARDVHRQACHPGPIHEMRVPGSGEGGHLLNVPAMMSHVVRRTVTRILAPVCRHRFDRKDCNFHPGQKTGRTLIGIARVINRNCHCTISVSLRQFFSAIGRTGLVRVLRQAVGSSTMASLVRHCLGTKIVVNAGIRPAQRKAPRNNPLDPLLTGVLLGRLSGRLREQKRPFIHCTSSNLVFYGDHQTTRHVGKDVAGCVRKALGLGIGHRGARYTCVNGLGFLNCNFCIHGNGYHLQLRRGDRTGLHHGLGSLASQDGNVKCTGHGAALHSCLQK